MFVTYLVSGVIGVVSLWLAKNNDRPLPLGITCTAIMFFVGMSL